MKTFKTKEDKHGGTIKKLVPGHVCKLPINWFCLRFSTGDEYECPCGNKYRYQPRPGFGNDYHWYQTNRPKPMPPTSLRAKHKEQ